MLWVLGAVAVWLLWRFMFTSGGMVRAPSTEWPSGANAYKMNGQSSAGCSLLAAYDWGKVGKVSLLWKP